MVGSRGAAAPILILFLAGPLLAQPELEGDVAAVRSQIPELDPARLAAYKRLEAQVSVELRKLEGDEGLGCFRRDDGTVEWGRALQAEVLACRSDGAPPVAGPAGRAIPHLPLGTFLRELARTVASGRRERVEELFQAVAQTDLYHTHGLLSLGGRLAAVNSAPRLNRFLGPAFVRQLLRAQADLAIAHLLPQLARGRLHRSTFAISLAGLGLDTRTVRDEIASLPWVARLGGLRIARSLGLLSKVGKLGTLRGFLFVVGETVVMVYFADDVEAWAKARLDRFNARQALADATRRLCKTAGAPTLAPDALAEELDEWDLAFGAWRDHLLAPAMAEEARLAQRLEPLARRAHQLDIAREALFTRAVEHPPLHEHLVARHGSLEGWWTARFADDERELSAALERELDAHAARVEEQVDAAYKPVLDRRPWLEGAPDEVLLGVATDAWAPRLASPTPSRLQSYQDQRDLLALLRRALERRHGAGSPLLREVDRARALVERTEALERGLLRPHRPGLADALDGR